MLYIYQQILSIPKKRHTKASFDYLPLEGMKTILSLPDMDMDMLKGRLNEPHKSSHNLFVNRMKQKLTKSGVNYILKK